MKIFVELDTGLFRSFRLHIFMYYFLTVSAFLLIEFYFLTLFEGKNSYLLGIVLLCFVILSGVFISKLAIDPLMEYVKNLQNLSKETLHELNLPITTIMTNLQMLRKNVSDEKSLTRLERIETACEMLTQRYNELEYLIKTQSRQEMREYFCVAELVRERIAFLQRVYPFAIFELDLFSYTLFGDKIGLAKVIDNLVDNAIKYSKEEKRVSLYLKEGLFEISDYGIGMDEVELLKIFDHFYQVNSSMKGFGIGLAMVKRFCDENGITLTINSTPNVGTKLSLEFKN